MEDKRFRRLEISTLRIMGILLGVIAIVCVGVVLKAAQGVVLPLILALLISNLFVPFVKFTTKKRIPAFISIIAVLAVFLGACTLGVLFMNGRIVSLAQSLPRYYDRLMALTKSLTAQFDLLPPGFWDSIDWGQKITSYLINMSGSVVSLLSNLVLVIFFMVFILLGSPHFEYKIRKAFSSSSATRVRNIMEGISFQVSRYLVLQTLISALTGFLVWGFLSLMKVDFAITWGVLTFILNFIPTIGSIIASIPPILLALVQFYPSAGLPVAVALGLLVIQMTVGNFVAPKLMGDNLNLSPVVVLLFLLFWGWLWGVVGALLSIPLASVIKITCENVPELHTISTFMGSGKSYRREFDKTMSQDY